MTTASSHTDGVEKRSTPAPWLSWLLPVGFGIVAAVLLAGNRGGGIPDAPQAIIDRADLSVGPRRVAMTDPAHIEVEGRSQSCSGCHQIFNSSHSAGTPPNYHQDIKFSHGLNNRCVNCHDASDRGRLTLRDGATVPFAQTPQLCAQCHGTLYRDWQRGTHGKTLGSWITHSEAQHRLSCNECHNPHSPGYEPYTPLPGPNTLRMGGQNVETPHGASEKISPLQRWLNRPESNQANTAPHSGDHP